jgi:adenosylmethionine-8-amino-7-oxononanoate aminotransferase
MGLLLTEQETVITYDRAGDTMNIYTADPYLAERLKKKPAYKLVREHRQEGQVVAVDFEADKRLLTFRSERKTKKPILSAGTLAQTPL